ncbi:hypothetical protein COX84_04795 [Candidatus Micrarchaeota archaeon CG_4_10_14_0_2_um_filter_49_7]|nr:MAG: hypothetical protein AUJ13_04725 [Candidatus Micrarchaeota archaeon CG1_02_49_24]PIZ94937.1 MAG: hypothetical protein COX84_04795 [Candidatus Micrarchaeota archaeon CG_4_10_14_0_2_um_filter_49_7]
MAKTLLEKFGFDDKDLKTPEHDNLLFKLDKTFFAKYFIEHLKLEFRLSDNLSIDVDGCGEKECVHYFRHPENLDYSHRVVCAKFVLMFVLTV